jgi:hypothetical protein
MCSIAFRGRTMPRLCELLQVTGLMERLGAERIYPSVRAAVTAYHEQIGHVK